MPDSLSQSGPKVSVIIVSYNTRQMTLDCIRTLYANLDGISAEVFVVDNASKDGTVEAVRAAFPAVRVIANAQNVGFGAANNQAMREADGAFFLLLNSDAFPRPGAIPALVRCLEENPEVGVVGPRLLNGDETLQTSCFRFPSPARAWLENLWISSLLPNHPVVGDYRQWNHDADRRVDFVTGACLLLRSEVFAQVGGFDEGFFLYSEETDWQRRIRNAGWDIAFTPHGSVIHLGGTSGASDMARINQHFFTSLDRYERKHHGLAGLISLRLAMTLGCFLRAALWGGVLCAMPKRRPLARNKARLQTWLFIRQATHWRGLRTPIAADGFPEGKAR